jgi:hypothetical protein
MKNIHETAELRFWVDKDGNEVDSGRTDIESSEVIVGPGEHFDVKIGELKKAQLMRGGFIAED